MGATVTHPAAALGLARCISLALAGLALSGSLQAQAPAAAAAPGKTPAKATAPTVPKAAKPSASAGFSVEPAPAWVDPLAIDAALVAKLPKAPLQLLALDHQTRIDRGEESHFIRSVRQIVDSAGLEPASQIQIEFDPSYQKLVLHKVELWRGGARIDKLDTRKIKLLQRESQLERQMVDGRSTASIVLDDVRVGDRVEFAYSLRGANPVFEGKFVENEWSVASKGPMAQMRYRLLAPVARDIKLRAEPGRHEITSHEANGWRETLVRRQLAPQFQYEAYTPANAYLADQIQFSEFADWGDVARWAARTFASASGAPTAAVQAQAERLAQAAGEDTAERVRRTLDFVQTEVRYFGTEIGANSHRPAEPEQVLKQRFGDCKDKTLLLAALLRAQGISATALMVSNSLRGDVADMLPSPLAFNHVIARVDSAGTAGSATGNIQWVLDGTRSRQTGPLAERESRGLGFGLAADAGATALSALPTTLGRLHTEAQDKVIFTRISDDPVLEAQLTYHGDYAENLRHSLDAQPASELERSFVGEYARHYTGAEVLEPMVVEEVEGHNSVRVRLKFKLPKYLRMPNQKQLVGDYGMPLIASELRLPDQVPRTRAMRLGTTGIYKHSVEFRFPEEVYSRDERQPLDHLGKHFELLTTTEGTRSSARFSAELRLLKDRVEPSEWAGHRDLLAKLWPRFSSTVALPAISQAQSKQLVDKLNATAKDIQAQRVKVKTQAQVEALAKTMSQQAVLDSGRLPPGPRATVLVDRGIQQDHLGLSTEAAASFTEALKLDPQNGEAHAGLSVNALMRRDDEQSISHASQALELSPTNTLPRYTRAYAQYYAGRTAEARDEFLEILKNRAEVDRSYATLWLHLATRRLGGDAAAATKVYQPADVQPSWPYPVMKLLNGTGTLDQALAAARADKDQVDGRLCELYFFLGQQQLLDGQAQAARDSFQKAVNTGVTEFTEYALAQRELSALAKR